MTQDANGIDQILRTLLDELSKQYFTDASMLPFILNNNEKWTRYLYIIDGLYQSVLTSIQFGQYRRAVWYLQGFSSMCDKIFGHGAQEYMVQTLRDGMQI